GGGARRRLARAGSVRRHRSRRARGGGGVARGAVVSAGATSAVPSADAAQLAAVSRAPRRTRRWSLAVGGAMVLLVLVAALVGPAPARHPPHAQPLDARL